MFKLSKMYGLYKRLWFITSFIIIIFANQHEAFRQKRFLIFPRQAPTRYQFIAGIGIPADLAYESLTIGYVLKAMYYLPYNATVFRENPFYPEYSASNYLQQRKSTMDSSLRWVIYKFIADRLESYGYNGQECILKAICESNFQLFDHHHNIFGELMHILLSPSSSKDFSPISTIEYFEAENLGKSNNGNCSIYHCRLSLLDLISNVFKIK